MSYISEFKVVWLTLLYPIATEWNTQANTTMGILEGQSNSIIVSWTLGVLSDFFLNRYDCYVTGRLLGSETFVC